MCFVVHNWLRLTGVTYGFAIYSSTVTDLYFPPALYEKLLNVQHDLEDLKELLPMKKGVLKSFQITHMQDVTETF